jgi:surface protein
MKRFLLLLLLLQFALGFSQEASVNMNRIDDPISNQHHDNASFLSSDIYAKTRDSENIRMIATQHTSSENLFGGTTSSTGISTRRSGESCLEVNADGPNFVDAFNCSSVSLIQTANDLTVAANEDFILENITAKILANGIVNVDVTYYKNHHLNNLPGEIIGSETSVNISNQTVTGNISGLNINEVELSVTPFTFFGESNTPTTYWIELSVTDEGSTGGVFWIVTSSNMEGFPAAQLRNGWALDANGKDGVYSWEGSCGPMTGGNYNTCKEENPNDFTFIDGYNCSATVDYRAANDLTVAAGEDFILRNITASIFANGGIANVDVIYYANNEDTNLPGSVIGSEESVEILSQIVIGNRAGFDVNEIELAVTPFTFNGQDYVESTYWIELSITDGSASGLVYWVTTNSSSNGFPIANYYLEWGYPNESMDGVYIWSSCETDTTIDCVNNIAYGSADVSTPGIKQISTCQLTNEYSTIEGVVAGFEYQFAGTPNTSSELPYITVRSGSYNGPVLSEGWSPLNVVAENSDNLFVHWNTDENCGTDNDCITTTAECLTCEDSLPSTEYFVTTWKTTSANESITIPTTGNGYDYLIEWGDGEINTGVTGDATHIYSEAGTYTVRIHGEFPRIYFNNSGDKNKIQTIEQWGAIEWTSMNSAFMGATNLVSNATDMPNLTMVTDMYGMFSYAASFNGDSNMGNWDVSNVTRMYGMFGGASNFNEDIGNWNVGNVVNMKLMFSHASSFNQDIGDWNVANVLNMDSMFRGASMFDQDLGRWNVGNVVNMSSMFKGVTLSTVNYDALLNGWNSLPLKNNIKFDGGNSMYCNGEFARQNMISTFNWTIVDGGMDCGANQARPDADYNQLLTEITMYPNPMRNQLILGNPTNIKLESASIFDISGRLIMTIELKNMSSEEKVDVSHLSRATYLVLLNAENGSQISKLLIKE